MRHFVFLTVTTFLFTTPYSTRWGINGQKSSDLQDRNARFLNLYSGGHTHTTTSHTCDFHSYRNLLNLRDSSKQCTTLDEALDDLYQLRLDDKHGSHCITNITKILYDAVHYSTEHCSSETRKYYFTSGSYYKDIHNDYDPSLTGTECYQDHRYYRELQHRYYHSVSGECVGLKEAMHLLSGMEDERCARDFVEHLHISFREISSSNRCHCTLGAKNINCDSVPEYNNLVQSLEKNNCQSIYSVWTPLQNLMLKNAQCFNDLITKFAETYGYNTSAPASCQCMETFPLDTLRFISLPDGFYRTCHYYRDYLDLVRKLIGGDHHHLSMMTCQTHHTLWSALKKLENTSHNCLEDAVAHIAASVKHYGDPCSCSQTALTTTPTTVSASSATTTSSNATTFKGFTCNKLKTVQSLGTHGQIDETNTHTCPDGIHVKSEAVPIALCGVPEKSEWKKGVNVLENCDNLPKYIAVASFIGDIYPGDGKAGVLISCNSTEITIVSQECDSGLKFEHITKGSYSYFKDIPEAYFTIISSSDTEAVFG